MTIARKLVVLVVVPLVAAVAFGSWALFASGGQAVRAERLRSLVAASSAAGDVAHLLREERSAAALVLLGGPDSLLTDYLARAAAADRAVGAYRQARGRVADVPAGTAVLLERIDGQLGLLEGLRGQVQARRDVALSAAAVQYRILIADLLVFRESVPQAGGAPADIADRVRAAAALSRAAEYVGQEQIAVLRAVAVGVLTPAGQQEITATRAGYGEAFQSFTDLADPRWRAWVDVALSGPEVLAAWQLQDAVARTAPGQRLRVDVGRWTAALGVLAGRLHGVRQRVDAELLTAVTGLRDGQRRLAVGESAGVVVTVAGAVGLALWLGRPMIGRLRTVRDAAKSVAYVGLPAAVARLHAPDGLDGVTPEEFAARTAAALPVSGGDEVGEVAAAFGEVYRAAVRIAAEQADQYRNVRQMFVDIARRGHLLSDRMTAELDAAEQGEEDPDRLARLFAIDNLLAQLAHANTSLLILGGQGRGLVRGADEPLARVLHAAVGKIADYRRIQLGAVDDQLLVDRNAVDHLVHLFAALLDNATRFSPPESTVRVTGHVLTARVVVQVIDEGVGIEPGRLAVFNDRLASPPRLGVEQVRSMGLLVVGQIAAQYDIRVELRPNPGRGLIADVTLPGTVLRLAARHGRPVMLPAGPVAGRPLTSAPSPEPAAAVPRQRPPAPAAQILPPSADPLAVATMELPILQAAACSTSAWFLAEASPAALPPGGRARPQSPLSPELGAGVTRGGLPRRRPGARLVGGFADEHPYPVHTDRRDAHTVAAAMRAWVRGCGTTSFSPTRSADGDFQGGI